MAGGTFDRNAGKVRPGTYINFESVRQDTIGTNERGVVIMPLMNHPYGPEKEFIRLYSSAPDAEFKKLGYSVYDTQPNMLMIHEAFKNATEVIVYIPRQGAKAEGTAGSLSVKAKYGGARGNDLKVTVLANPENGFDVTVLLGGDVMEIYEGVATIAELAAKGSAWVDFSGEGALAAVPGVSLAGGENGIASNADIAQFLDDCEGQVWNTMAFPMAKTSEQNDPAAALHEAVRTKIKYLREEAGKYRKAVVPGFAADYEGIINVTNSVKLSDGSELTAAQATAWVAGADAAAGNNQSLTYRPYTGAVDVVGAKNHAQAVAAINNGEFFFSMSEMGEVIVEYDINSLVTFASPKDSSYRKNRVMRVFDSFAEAIMTNFPPNKFNNDSVGWDVMEGIGKTILQQFEDAGAISNVDYANDFKIDRGLSSGDETYFNVALMAADSAEKLFFTVKTR